MATTKKVQFQNRATGSMTTPDAVRSLMLPLSITRSLISQHLVTNLASRPQEVHNVHTGSMSVFDVWSGSHRLITQNRDYFIRAWDAEPGFSEEHRARQLSLQHHLEWNSRSQQHYERGRRHNQVKGRFANSGAYYTVLTATLVVEAEMAAHAYLLSPTRKLDSMPFMMSPSLPPGTPRYHSQGLACRAAPGWVEPLWHDNVVASTDMTGDLSEPLRDESFKYPHEHGGLGLPDYNCACNNTNRVVDIDSRSMFESDTEPSPEYPPPSFATFSFVQDVTSPKALVNPRYICRAKHARGESATISPRTLKRPFVPPPIATGPMFTMPLAIRTASTLRPDATPFTPMFTTVPNTVEHKSEAPFEHVTDREDPNVQVRQLGDSAAAADRIRWRLKQLDEKDARKSGRRHRRRHASEEDITTRVKCALRHDNPTSAPGSFSFVS